jgi:hypothetical protein
MESFEDSLITYFLLSNPMAEYIKQTTYSHSVMAAKDKVRFKNDFIKECFTKSVGEIIKHLNMLSYPVCSWGYSFLNQAWVISKHHCPLYNGEYSILRADNFHIWKCTFQ